MYQVELNHRTGRSGDCACDTHLNKYKTKFEMFDKFLTNPFHNQIICFTIVAHMRHDLSEIIIIVDPKQRPMFCGP